MNSNTKAEVHTLEVSINVLRIGGRQVTRNILEQIPDGCIFKQHPSSKELLEIYQYLGWVKDIKSPIEQVFLIFIDEDGILKKSAIVRGYLKPNCYPTSPQYWADVFNTYPEKDEEDESTTIAIIYGVNQKELISTDDIYSSLTEQKNHLYIQA